jgi:hypothetical protein
VLEQLVFRAGDLEVIVILAANELEERENQVTVEVRYQLGQEIVFFGDFLGGLGRVGSGAVEERLCRRRSVVCHDGGTLAVVTARDRADMGRGWEKMG